MRSEVLGIMLEGDDYDAPANEDGVRVLRQEFVVPEGTMAVRMQVGDLPVTIVGWISGSESLPGLLRDVSDELERILIERASED
jgi:hypothetical protein